MIRISEPSHDYASALDECISGIALHMPLRRRLLVSRAALVTEGIAYEAAARGGVLANLQPFRGQNMDIVLEAITKADLLKMYDQYLVPEAKTGRKVYDAIMSAALEKCPFCGGIGTPRNLDHFLPKAHFPQFSVLPHNLVPACRDCNMDGKASTFATSFEDQIIHPYLEEQRFFDEQWVFATYIPPENDATGRMEYFAQAPAHWSEIDKARVTTHFQSFNLAKRYSVKAAEHLPTVLSQMNRMIERQLALAIPEVLLQPGVSEAPFVNHWQKGFYQAMIRARAG